MNFECVWVHLYLLGVAMLVYPQSLEVSKIKKNKKNFEKFWSSIINKGSYEMGFLCQHVNND
jgi:hypothetical protein